MENHHPLTEQSAFASIVKIKKEEEQQLRELLNKIGEDVNNQQVVPFHKLTKIHYARWVIVEGEKTSDPSVLAFSSNFDGTLDAHLEEIAVEAEKALDQIYQHCEGYPETPSTKNRMAYLKAHSASPATFYVGTTRRSITQIKDEYELYNTIQEFLDNNEELSEKPPEDIWKEVKNHVSSKFTWAATPPGKPGFGWKFNYWSKLIVIILGILALVALPFVLACLFIPGWNILVRIILIVIIGLSPGFYFLWRLRTLEKSDIPGDDELSIKTEQFFKSREDFLGQNQLTHLVNIKPGGFRHRTIRAVLWALNLAAIYIYNKGHLGGIPSIHFARWTILPGNRLLFFSNFDGSWTNYLGDFIDQGSSGLTGVWSNTEGYPRSRYLIQAGSTQAEKFKTWTRYHQISTQIWYTAYPNISVGNINNNTKIRLGLAAESMTKEEATKWLRLL